MFLRNKTISCNGNRGGGGLQRSVPGGRSLGALPRLRLRSGSGEGLVRHGVSWELLEGGRLCEGCLGLLQFENDDRQGRQLEDKRVGAALPPMVVRPDASGVAHIRAPVGLRVGVEYFFVKARLRHPDPVIEARNGGGVD